MDYVYFLGNANDSTTLIKIGVAVDIAQRIYQLQTLAPFKLTCFEYVEAQGRAYEIEKALHRHFRTRRVKGEWFDIRKDEIIPAVLQVCEGMNLGDPEIYDHKGQLPPRMAEALERAC
jgi:hypothetical protein